MIEFFIKFSPVVVFSIHGNSMVPTLLSGSKVIGISTMFVSIQKGDIVICQNPKVKRTLIKRIFKIKNGKYFVVGDNKKESTDSREFGWISKHNIIAKVIYPKITYNT